MTANVLKQDPNALKGAKEHYLLGLKAKTFILG